MKTRISWVAVGNLIGLIASMFVILNTLYVVVIEPFFTKEIVGLSPIGVIVLLLAIAVGGINFGYLEDRMNR